MSNIKIIKKRLQLLLDDTIEANSDIKFEKAIVEECGLQIIVTLIHSQDIVSFAFDIGSDEWSIYYPPTFITGSKYDDLLFNVLGHSNIPFFDKISQYSKAYRESSNFKIIIDNIRYFSKDKEHVQNIVNDLIHRGHKNIIIKNQNTDQEYVIK